MKLFIITQSKSFAYIKHSISDHRITCLFLLCFIPYRNNYKNIFLTKGYKYSITSIHFSSIFSRFFHYFDVSQTPYILLIKKCFTACFILVL